MADEVAHEEGAKAGLEGDMEQDEAGFGVVEAHVEGEVADRNHQDLERHEVARDEHEEDPDVRIEFVDPKRETGHGRESDGADHGGDGDQERVQHVARHVGVEEHLTVVGEAFEGGRHAPVVALGEVDGRFDRKDGDGDQGQEPQDQRDRQKGLVGDLIGDRAFLDWGGEHPSAPFSSDHIDHRK